MVFLIVVFSKATVFGADQESTKDRVDNCCSSIERLLGYFYTRGRTTEINEETVVGDKSEARSKESRRNVAAQGSEIVPIDESIQANVPQSSNVSEASEDTEKMYREMLINQRKMEGYKIIPVSEIEDFWTQYESRDADDEFCEYANITDEDLTKLANSYLKGVLSSCAIGNYGKFLFKNETNNLLLEISEGSRWYAKINRGQVVGFAIEDSSNEESFDEYEIQSSYFSKHRHIEYIDLLVHEDFA